MSRRHRHRQSARLLIPVGAALAVWAWYREPAGWAGLGLGVALFLAGWLAVAVLVPAVLAGLMGGLLVPRHTRAAYRKRRKDAGYARSNPIQAWLRRAVLAADRHQCVYCGLTFDLQIDHYFPYSLGGRATLTNCLTLCGTHNRIKSDYWRDRDGYVHYHPYGRSDIVMAADILATERRVRRNPVRWVRAALALAA